MTLKGIVDKPMKNYLYDGTFNGLLTCIWHHYYNDKAKGIFVCDDYQWDMLTAAESVETDDRKALKVYKAVKEKMSYTDLERIYRVLMSCRDEKEMIILRYLELGFKTGPAVSMLHGDPAVHAAQSAETDIANEIHRLKGLIRFRDLNFTYNGSDICYAGPDPAEVPSEDTGSIPYLPSREHPGTGAAGDIHIFYSDIEPKNDLIEFLAPHFCSRFREQSFIIHDVRRKKALFASKGSWYIGPLTRDQIPSPREDDMFFQKLWQGYFASIAIKERTNPRCQKNFMPMRYWKFLTELQDQK